MTQPVGVVAPGALEFASQPYETASASQQVTVTNAGATALNLSGVTFTGASASDFFISGSTCGERLPGGETCKLWVGFAPDQEGKERERTATLVLDTNATPATYQVPVSGIAAELPQGPAGQPGSPARTGQMAPTAAPVPRDQSVSRGRPGQRDRRGQRATLAPDSRAPRSPASRRR